MGPRSFCRDGNLLRLPRSYEFEPTNGRSYFRVLTTTGERRWFDGTWAGSSQWYCPVLPQGIEFCVGVYRNWSFPVGVFSPSMQLGSPNSPLFELGTARSGISGLNSVLGSEKLVLSQPSLRNKDSLALPGNASEWCPVDGAQFFLWQTEMAEECCSLSPREWVRGSVVGAGAFGTVSLAMNKANGELFAVKSIECNEDARRELQALENEVQILQALDSPRIVTCLGHDFTEENGVRMWNLFMEYMAGGSVADILKKFGGRLDESVIRSYTRDILQGIDYLHKEGIVHCDIKGKNILLGSSGVKLADFGSAKRMVNNESKMRNENTNPLQLRGTPLWMAPEVARQEEQGPESDIWSLGCTVVEMATGRPPWSNISHPLVAMYKIGCSDDLPEMPESLSSEGIDFLQKCFQRNPKQRWTSTQLLNHPFVNELCPVQDHPEHKGSWSPTSILDFHLAEQKWDSEGSSALSQTVPILALHMNLSNSKQAQNCEEEKKPNAKNLRLPPTQRILDFSETQMDNSVSGCISSAEPISERPPPSPLGQWIVVRSPKGMPPMLDGPFTDLIDGSFGPNSPPHSPLQCSPKLEAMDCGETESEGGSCTTMVEPKSKSSVVNQIEESKHGFSAHQTQELNHGFPGSTDYEEFCTIHGNLVQIGMPTYEPMCPRPLLNYEFSSNLFLYAGQWIYQSLYQLKEAWQEFVFCKPLPLSSMGNENKGSGSLAYILQRNRAPSLQVILQNWTGKNDTGRECFKLMPKAARSCNIATMRVNYCSSDEGLVFDIQAEACCCPCCIICTRNSCHMSRMKSILYSGGGVNASDCYFNERIIPVHFTWLNLYFATYGWGQSTLLFCVITPDKIFVFVSAYLRTHRLETPGESKRQQNGDEERQRSFLKPFSVHSHGFIT
eukprot:Gb_01891 [translate_table: standard]